MHRLLAPYWRTLAPTVAQDLQRRPQIAQYLSDLMSVNVAELLRLTQTYTLPYLVLTKQQNILQRVADACGRSIKDLCMEPVNTSAILAYILLRSASDAEITIMTAFQSASSEFLNVDCAELIKAEPVLIASELLKAAGDADDDTKPKVIFHQRKTTIAKDLLEPSRMMLSNSLQACRTVGMAPLGDRLKKVPR